MWNSFGNCYLVTDEVDLTENRIITKLNYVTEWLIKRL